jgi:hypothetical protein
MAEKSNLIREQIEETKGEIRDDVASLESQIRSTVRGVKENFGKFSPSHQVREFPLWAVGGSLAAGWALGSWVGGRSSGASFQGAGLAAVPESNVRRGPGPFDAEIKMVKGMVLGALTRGLGDAAKKSFPSFAEQIDEVIGRVSAKVEHKAPRGAEMGEGSHQEWAPAATETPSPDGEPKSYH